MLRCEARLKRLSVAWFGADRDRYAVGGTAADGAAGRGGRRVYEAADPLPFIDLMGLAITLNASQKASHSRTIDLSR
jgi:hypothetical protein